MRRRTRAKRLAERPGQREQVLIKWFIGSTKQQFNEMIRGLLLITSLLAFLNGTVAETLHESDNGVDPLGRSLKATVKQQVNTCFYSGVWKQCKRHCDNKPKLRQCINLAARQKCQRILKPKTKANKAIFINKVLAKVKDMCSNRPTPPPCFVNDGELCAGAGYTG